jgi:hypothetical protein
VVFVLLAACGPSVEDVSAMAGAAPHPCTASVPADLRSAELITAYQAVLTRRCGEEQCVEFRAAVGAGDAAVVTRLLATATCPGMAELKGARDAQARARAAADARPARWDEAINTLQGAPQLPPELRRFGPAVAELDELYVGCHRDAAAAATSAFSMGDWPSARAQAALALRCAEALPSDRRPTAEALTQLHGVQQHASICAGVAAAVPAGGELVARLETILGLISPAQAVAGGGPSAGDVSRITRALASARAKAAQAQAASDREDARCERKENLRDRCIGRCDDMAERAPDGWYDRCLEYCAQRAPTCEDEDDPVAEQDSPDEVVPALEYCASGASVGTAPSPEVRRTGTSRTRNQGVSDDDFE